VWGPVQGQNWWISWGTPASIWWARSITSLPAARQGPCDGLGGWTKTYLLDEEIKKGNHMGTSHVVFDCLVYDKQYGNNDEWEAVMGVQLKAKSRTFVFVESVGVDRDVVKDLGGLKSNHCFVAVAGVFIRKFPTSCTCSPLQGYGVREMRAGGQGEAGGGEADTTVSATQELRSKRGSNFELGRAVLKECEVGNSVLMRTDEEQRKVYSEDHSKNWTCRGISRLAQITQLPTSAMEGGRPSSRARRGVGKFLVFYAEEVQAENEWLFQSELVCYREGENVPKMWNDCSESNDDPCMASKCAS